MDGFIGVGDLYIDRLAADGSSQGLLPAGNSVKLEIKANADSNDLVSRGRDTAGQVLASVTKQQPADLAISINQVDHTNLALAFMGDTAAINETGGTNTDQPVTALLDKWVELGGREVSSVVVTDDTSSTTYVEGTDYMVNARMGWIKPLSTGTITDAQALLATFDTGAVTGHRVTGATQPTIKAKLILDGKNDVNGKPCQVTIWEAQLKPSEAVDFLAEDYAALALEGTMITPSGKSSPFQVDMLDS